MPLYDIHFCSLAYIEIFVRNDRDTKQLVLARTVASINLPCVILGSWATTFRWIFIMVQPAVRYYSVTVAEVTISPGANAFNPNSFDNAMEKLPA